MIKKVTVKFDSCGECPVFRYAGCKHAAYDGAHTEDIPDTCPIDTSVMMYRYTEFRTYADKTENGE